jgi:hypothetical protein
MLRTALFLALLLVAPVSAADENDPMQWATGLELMEAVRERHQLYPYVYEEQSLVLTDRHGRRETRQVRTYMRMEDDGSVKYLLLFDSPSEVEGVALMAVRDPEGETRKYFYLPAHGGALLEAGGDSYGQNFLGTDFAVEDLTGEVLDDYRYSRQRDERINGAPHYVVDAYRRSEGGVDGPVEMRHYIAPDKLVVVRTDYLDQFGRLRKRQGFHDLRPVGGGAWRANLIHMDDLRNRHQSLIRVERRVFSRDYVPSEIFTAEWLQENQQPIVVEATEDAQ